MKVKPDLFISYAHIDNQQLPGQADGWITKFHEALSVVLSMRLGRQPRIWRDRKLSGNDVFSDEIFSQLDAAATLVAVVSPRYVESEWCRDEVVRFCARAEESMGLVLGNKARVLKVTKLPVRNQTPLPPVMQETLGVDFYELDAGEVAFELDPAFGPDKLLKFNVKLVHLAEQIRQLLEQIEEIAAADSAAADAGGTATAAASVSTVSRAPVATGPVVYLAECSYDLRDTRDLLRTELRARGCTVLPERELPRSEEEYVREVDELLARADLSIHLVGRQYGAVPDGPSQRAVPVLQNERAAARSRSHGLSRLVWVPRAAEVTDQKQMEFVTALQRDPDAQLGADLITGDVETLKGAVAGAMATLAQKAAAVAAESTPVTESSRPLLYLIFDKRDREARSTRDVRLHLSGAGVDVVTPLFTGDATEIRATHLIQLERADAVMVFYGAGEETWKRTVDEDLRKATALRSGRRVPGPLTYVHGEVTGDKDDLLMMGAPSTLDATSGTPVAALDALVRRMQGLS